MEKLSRFPRQFGVLKMHPSYHTSLRDARAGRRVHCKSQPRLFSFPIILEMSLAKAVCLRRADVFQNDASGEYFVGVWDARNASRLRSELRAHMQIAVHKEVPDAHLKHSPSARSLL
jgi:hypothetical protein